MCCGTRNPNTVLWHAATSAQRLRSAAAAAAAAAAATSRFYGTLGQRFPGAIVMFQEKKSSLLVARRLIVVHSSVYSTSNEFESGASVFQPRLGSELGPGLWSGLG